MGKKILVAEDDEGIRDVLQILLEGAGYDLDLTTNAEDILEGNHKTPDLFILDKVLPGMSGLDICRIIKANPLTKNIPVMMFSASPDIGTLANEAGANSWLSKPFEVREFMNLVKDLLNQMVDSPPY